MVSNSGQRSLSDIAYEEIKNMLLEFELHPGSPITEIMLMEKLGTSRTPVRQALQRLLYAVDASQKPFAFSI